MYSYKSKRANQSFIGTIQVGTSQIKLNSVKTFERLTIGSAPRTNLNTTRCTSSGGSLE